MNHPTDPKQTSKILGLQKKNRWILMSNREMKPTIRMIDISTALLYGNHGYNNLYRRLLFGIQILSFECIYFIFFLCETNQVPQIAFQ